MTAAHQGAAAGIKTGKHTLLALTMNYIQIFQIASAYIVPTQHVAMYPAYPRLVPSYTQMITR
jgi:hypothetical protein